MRLSADGIAVPTSHLDIACRDTFIASANSAWDRPFFFLRSTSFSLSSIHYRLQFYMKRSLGVNRKRFTPLQLHVARAVFLVNFNFHILFKLAFMVLPILLQQLSNQITNTPPLHIGNLLNVFIKTGKHRQAHSFLCLPVLLGPSLLPAGRCRHTIDHASDH